MQCEGGGKKHDAIDPFRKKMPLGISVAPFHTQQTRMVPFKFEVNGMLDGVDMTPNLVWRHLQCKSLIIMMMSLYMYMYM